MHIKESKEAISRLSNYYYNMSYFLLIITLNDRLCDKRSFSPVVVFSKQVFFQLGKIVDDDREKKTFRRHRRLLCRRDVFSPESVGFAAARRTTKKTTTTTTTMPTTLTFGVEPVAKKTTKGLLTP